MSITGAVVGLTRTLCRSRTLTRVVAAIGLALWLHPSALTQSPAKPPARIVSLIPATTEMLFAVGAGDRVVGVGSFDRFPPEVEKLPRVGALLDPDVERILALRPDLVVVYRSQTDLLAQLARAQIPVVRLRARRPGRRDGHTPRARRASRRRRPGQRLLPRTSSAGSTPPGSAMPPGAGRRR